MPNDDYAAARRIFNEVKRDGRRVLTLPEIQRVIDAHTAATAATAAACTGLTATWCPVHGDCRCERADGDPYEGPSDDGACPLHAHDSPHAEG